MLLSIGSTVQDDNDNIYVLDEIIGHGGFGYVFKSHRKSDDKVFAIKTTLPFFSNSSSHDSFKNEIRLASKIQGNNIIEYTYVHDGETYQNFPPFIIMEYAEGGTLNSILNKRKQDSIFFNNKELKEIYTQLAKGMKQINDVLVHRDIKPDNILICNDTLKIADFGLSKVASEQTRTMTFKGAGTPLYMAPESWDFSKNTIQMDIYSMGIIFYELATLQYPYHPIPDTIDKCKEAHIYSAITNPSKINTLLSPSLASLINRMLEKSTKKRLKNWDEIIEVLDNQSTSPSPLDKYVNIALTTKNIEDIQRQEIESQTKQKEKERENFIKLVHSQYSQNILSPIIELVEKINEQYAGNNKLTYPKKPYNILNQTNFSWRLTAPPNNHLTINFEVVLNENFYRDVYVDRIFGGNRTKRENYIPQYKNKNILGWGEIKNSKDFGFNILLLGSDDIYGDWIIMNNKNNFSYGTTKERKEPFAFSLNELPTEIDKVQITHLYSSTFDNYTEDLLLDSISFLLFNK